MLWRVLAGIFVVAGCWIGMAQLGAFLFPGSDLMIIFGAAGMIGGVGLAFNLLKL